MFETTVRDGVTQLGREGTRWLSTGWSGGESTADAAYNVTVPEGWECESIEAYLEERLTAASFQRDGPALFTGVDQRHARGARLGSVEALATAGVSNPAALPMEPSGKPLDDAANRSVGTVNVVVGTTRALAPGALANLVAVAAEAKAATLLAEAGFPGTTTDAVVAACDPDGEAAAFSGSATAVGAAARACVRDAVRASVRSRYDGDAEIPSSVADAEHGVVTDERAEVFEP